MPDDLFHPKPSGQYGEQLNPCRLITPSELEQVRLAIGLINPIEARLNELTHLVASELTAMIDWRGLMAASGILNNFKGTLLRMTLGETYHTCTDPDERPWRWVDLPEGGRDIELLRGPL